MWQNCISYFKLSWKYKNSKLSEPCMLRRLYNTYRVLRNTRNSFTTKYIHTHTHKHKEKKKERTQRTQRTERTPYLCRFARECRQTIPIRSTRCDVICADDVLCRDQAGNTSLSLTQLHGPYQSAIRSMHYGKSDMYVHDVPCVL